MGMNHVDEGKILFNEVNEGWMQKQFGDDIKAPWGALNGKAKNIGAFADMVVSDFKDYGFNYGCTVYAARMIASRGRKGKSTSWRNFRNWVNKKGGFLSPALEKEVHALWNCHGNDAYSHYWARGLEPKGYDEYGIVWGSNPDHDFREELLECLR